MCLSAAGAANCRPQRRVQLYSRDQQADATLREISGSADPLTRSWRARYAIEGDPQAWALGSSVTLELVQAVNGQALQQVARRKR